MSDSELRVDNTMGAALIGVICAACLYGVSCVQTWYYFNQYASDPWYIKVLVLVVWSFDTVHQALICHTVYFYVITNYSKPETLGALIWSILLEVLFNGLVGFLVQMFLTMRVWRLSDNSRVIPSFLSTLVFAGFACSAVFTIQSLQLATWEDLSKLKGLSMTVNVLGAVTDVLIAASLFFYLHRSRTGFKKSDTMISKLILYSVSTGLLTSVCAVGSLVSIIAWPTTLIYVAFYFSLGRLYSNSILATLNARKGIRGLSYDTEDQSFSIQTFSKTLRKSRKTNSSPALPMSISVKIDTIQDLVRDGKKSESSHEYCSESSADLEPIAI